MRIINLEEFLKLPKGTVFMYYRSQVLSEPFVKDDNTRHVRDFYCSSLTDEIDAGSSDERMKKLFLMEEDSSISVAIDFNCVGRDASYNDDQMFAVYEKSDMLGLICKLCSCFNLTTGEVFTEVATALCQFELKEDS